MTWPWALLLIDTVVQNPVAQSWTWEVPPDTLQGLVAHPGGFLVGFDGHDLYCSVPYRPHAWPSAYVLSLEHRIVGLAIYNNMITVLTDGAPYFVAGNRPESLYPIKSDAAEPCLSKASIASTLQGVLYASPNGLVLFNENGPQIVTAQVMTIEEWFAYSPTNIRGTQYGMQYIGFYNTTQGFKYAPGEQLGIFSELNFYDGVDNIITDDTTGECWVLINNNVYKWEPPGGLPLQYVWRSKEFDFTRPVNFGAYHIKMGNETYAQTAEYLTDRQDFNDAIVTEDIPINPLNHHPIGHIRKDVATSAGGGYWADPPPYIDLSSYGEDVKAVHQNIKPINGGYKYNINQISGFKAHVWQFELEGNDDVFSLGIAETPKELQNV